MQVGAMPSSMPSAMPSSMSSAMSSSVAGMRSATALLDSAAARVAHDGAVTVDAPLTGAPPADDGLVTAVPDLLLSGVLMKANAAVARTAQEAYQAALDQLAPR